jgi:hypothetical protein
LLAGKQRATTPGIIGFALVQGTVCANLTSSVFGVLFGVGFCGIRHIAQGHRLWAFFVSLCLAVGRSGQKRYASGQRYEKGASLVVHGNSDLKQDRLISQQRQGFAFLVLGDFNKTVALHLKLRNKLYRVKNDKLCIESLLSLYVNLRKADESPIAFNDRGIIQLIINSSLEQ